MFSKMQSDFLKNKHLNNVHLGFPQRKAHLILQDKHDLQKKKKKLDKSWTNQSAR